MHSILFAEDEIAIAEVLIFNLREEGYEVTHAKNGSEALDIFKTNPLSFACVILDVMMPLISGWDVCLEIKKINPVVPVIMVTARGESEDRIRGLRIGADDYLVKPFDLEELLLRVRNLIRRFGAEKPVEMFVFGHNAVDGTTWEATNFRGEKIQLTKREISLLKLLYGRKNEVVSRDEILECVWEASENPSSRTIDNMVLGFRKFFEIEPRNPAHFISIRAVGYKLIA